MFYSAKASLSSLRQSVLGIELACDGCSCDNFKDKDALLIQNFWTSVLGDPYITLSSHFIDSSWAIKTYCLQTHYLHENHTAVNISEVLAETLQEWKLEQLQFGGEYYRLWFKCKAACKILGWVALDTT